MRRGVSRRLSSVEVDAEGEQQLPRGPSARAGSIGSAAGATE